MPARSVVASVTVPVSPQAAWELLCDTSRYAEWVDATDSVVRTDGPAREGSTYDERNTVLGPVKTGSRWTVVEHEPPRRTLHRGEGILLASEASIEMSVAPVAGEAAEVTLTFRYTPALGPAGRLLASAVLHRRLEAGFRRSADAFAQLAAREAAAIA